MALMFTSQSGYQSHPWCEASSSSVVDGEQFQFSGGGWWKVADVDKKLECIF